MNRFNKSLMQLPETLASYSPFNFNTFMTHDIQPEVIPSGREAVIESHRIIDLKRAIAEVETVPAPKAEETLPSTERYFSPIFPQKPAPVAPEIPVDESSAVNAARRNVYNILAGDN